MMIVNASYRRRFDIAGGSAAFRVIGQATWFHNDNAEMNST